MPAAPANYARRPRPPLDGSLRALVGHTDWQAEYNTTQPFTVFPRQDDPHTLMELSCMEFALATHRIAHTIRPGREGDFDGKVMGMLLNTDTLMYQALIVGVMRAGFVAFPLSPRNTAEAVYHLLKVTDSHHLLTHPPMYNLLREVQSLAQNDAYNIEVLEVPSLATIYPTISTKHGQEVPAVSRYPPSTKPHKPDDVACILHSSGSTGLPKPIPQTERRMKEWALALNYNDKLPQVTYGCMATPTFHAMGFTVQLILPLTSSQTIAVFTPLSPSPPVIPNVNNTLELARLAECKVMPSVPAFLEEWAHSEEAVELLASMYIIPFGGGPVPKATGDKLIMSGVNLSSVYGATETAGCCVVFNSEKLEPNSDWEWLSFPSFVSIRWVPQGDDTFELQVLSNEHFSPALENLTDVKGYSTKDLFVRHPTNPNLWKIVGRLDDVIVLGSAEKIVPLAQEGFLQSASFISGAVMFGRGRNQPGLLLEPRPDFVIDPKDQAALSSFRNKIWPYVEEANKLAPQFARVFKEMIIVTSPDKPLSRAAKGTIQRRQIYNQYAQEIDELYDTVDASTDANGISAPDSWSPEVIEAWLLEHATVINNGKPPSPTQDLFEQGFDSMSATFLRNRILGAFRSSLDPSVQAAALDLPADIIFANPTIKWLSSVVAHLADPSSVAASTKDIAAEIEDLVAKYTKDLPIVKGKKPIVPSNGFVVVLTGSTGALGSHLLADLLANDYVKTIYTLDRAENIQDRQQLAFQDRQLPLNLLRSSKLNALTVSTTRADLGLEKHVLDQLRSSATHIIHNAWRVDFNLSLSSFENNIAYARRLIDLAASCPNATRFFFTSSISAAIGWGTARGPVPEYVNEDPHSGASFGYGSSKYTTERIVAEAARKGLPAMSIRIGQICGSTTTGAWNTSDWVPIIIKSSLHMGALPIFTEEIAWLPMDVTTGAVVDTLFSCSQKDPPELINLVHPRPVKGTDVFEAVRAALGRPNLTFVPFKEWISKLEDMATGATEVDFQRIPALKTMEFLRLSRQSDEMLAFETTKAQALSETLRNAKTLGSDDAAQWIHYWKNKGLFD